MAVGGFMSVVEASEQLGVNSSRVRVLLAEGQLTGEKLGGRWVVSQESVRERRRRSQGRGRQLRPANAWTVLSLASGKDPSLADSPDRRRLFRLLDERGLVGLAPRLYDRASVRRFYGHPGVLRRLAENDAICLTGANATGAHDLELVPGEEIDGYIPSDVVERIIKDFALEPGDIGTDANVVLRVLPKDLTLPGGAPAPLAAVALDLAGQAEPRAQQIGKKTLKRLDDEQRWRSIEALA